MAHFAKLDENNIVVDIQRVHNDELLVNGVESEDKGIEFLKSLFGGNWIQTSYNANFRKKYAAIGDSWDSERDAFILPKPFPSWTLDENAEWQPPVAYPTDELFYIWNEDTKNWDKISDSI